MKPKTQCYTQNLLANFGRNQLLNFCVSLCAALCRQDQGARSIHLGHVHLDKGQATGVDEFLFGDQRVELTPVLDDDSPGLLAGLEDIQELLVVPVADVVVQGGLAVNATFNGEAIVANDEAERAMLVVYFSTTHVGGVFILT